MLNGVVGIDISGVDANSLMTSHAVTIYQIIAFSTVLMPIRYRVDTAVEYQ